MTFLLLAVIYVVFISLGLPDGLLGSAWPAIQASFHAPVGLGGALALLATLMTMVSSLSTSFLIKKIGTGPLLVISTALTAGALLGSAQASSLYWLFLLAIPLGLGAGAIDTALNNYVATHYKAHHMNWLHAFWGLGAALGPVLFAVSLANTGDWHAGYGTLGVLQAGIVVLLAVSLPLWNRAQNSHPQQDTGNDFTEASYGLLIKDKAVLLSFLTFLLYVGIEVGIGLWLASYLVSIQNVAIEVASFWVGLYYGAITVGRVFAGFVSFKIPGTITIRAGMILAIVGALLLVAHVHSTVTLLGIVLVGIGFAPVYPSLIHETPARFGKRASAKIMSLQMVGSAAGASIIPPLIGLFSNQFSLMAFAVIVPLVLIMQLITSEYINKLVAKQ